LTKRNPILIIGFNDFRIKKGDKMIQTILFDEIKMIKFEYKSEPQKNPSSIQIIPKNGQGIIINNKSKILEKKIGKQQIDYLKFQIQSKKEWNRLVQGAIHLAKQ